MNNKYAASLAILLALSAPAVILADTTLSTTHGANDNNHDRNNNHNDRHNWDRHNNNWRHYNWHEYNWRSFPVVSHVVAGRVIDVSPDAVLLLVDNGATYLVGGDPAVLLNVAPGERIAVSGIIRGDTVFATSIFPL